LDTPSRSRQIRRTSPLIQRGWWLARRPLFESAVTDANVVDIAVAGDNVTVTITTDVPVTLVTSSPVWDFEDHDQAAPIGHYVSVSGTTIVVVMHGDCFSGDGCSWPDSTGLIQTASGGKILAGAGSID
jgi:hypothetical protein